MQSGLSLSVNCAMCIDAESYQVDLFVDGKLRHTWVLEESEDIDQSEEIEFDQGITIRGRSWWEGNMKVSTSAYPEGESDSNDETHTADTVSSIAANGTIVIRISKPNNDRTYYEALPASEPVGSFHGQDFYSGILPLHMITFGHTKLVTNNRVLRTQLKQQRPGEAPWATFIFLYRSKG